VGNVGPGRLILAGRMHIVGLELPLKYSENLPVTKGAMGAQNNAPPPNVLVFPTLLEGSYEKKKLPNFWGSGALLNAVDPVWISAPLPEIWGSKFWKF
jgi:hypothetical protein